MRSFNLNDEEVINKLRNDPKFFLENFTKMKTKTAGLQKYTLKPHQIDLINGIMENERVICLKARQMGCSTIIVGLFYHNTIFNAGFNTALIGYNSSLAKEFMEKVKTFYRTTPDRFKPAIEYNSKEEMTFPKLESKIFLLAASDNLARGWCLHRALCSELPFWENADDKMQAVKGSVAIDIGRLVIESTPSSVSSLFYQMWINPDNGYVKKEYGWWWEYCLDDQTEILTVDGWKKREDFHIGDKHFTVNLKTKKIEIKIATDKIDHMYNGDMIHFQSQNLDLMVTPNHRCIIQSSSNYQSVDHKTLNGEWVLKQAQDLKRWDFMPLVTKGWHEKKVKKYSDEFVELIGWVITESSFEKYLIYIAQNVGKNLDRIENACKKLGYKYTKYIRPNGKLGEIRIHSAFTKDIRRVLKGKNKNLPMSFLLSLTHDQLLLLQRIMIMADGSIDCGFEKTLERCDTGCSFVQKDKNVSDNFQVLATLIGHPSSIKQNKKSDKCYCVRVKKCQIAQEFSKKYEKYNGYIWCPTNDNGTIIVRRNGKVMLTGQTKEQVEKIKRDMGDPDRFAQEYELMFTASGRSVFDVQTILKHRKNELHVGDPVVSDDLDGVVHQVIERPDGLRIYKNPRKNHQYIMGVDVAEGLHDGDFSCVVVIDRTDQEEVAFYRGHVAPDHLAQMMNEWGRIYNDALAVVEVNGHGITTLTELKNLFYPSIYFRPSKFEGMSQDMSNKIGWRTTQLTRPLMLDDFRRAFRDGDITLHSKEIFDECSTFVFDDANNMRAERGAHDDTIMALAVGIQGFKSISREKLTQLNCEQILPMNFCY